MQTKRNKIGRILVHEITGQEVLNKIADLGHTRTPSYVCFANAHMVHEGYKSSTFAGFVNQATIVAADGVPVAKAFNFLYGIKQERIAGMDMMAKIIAACEKQNLSLFLFGSTTEILRVVVQKIEQQHPRLTIAGVLSPTFNDWTPQEATYYVDLINKSEAQVVLVSLGCPKQEIWMANHYRTINAVLIGIGGVFAVYGGLRKRAPYWMQEWSLEWLFRLIQEPKRMFKRYMVSNTLFIVLLMFQWIKLRLVKHRN